MCPSYPSWEYNGRQILVGELDARVLLTDTEFSQALRHHIGAGIVELPPEPPGVDVPSVQVRTVADQPAYIYFTSGSTGRPKGVIIYCHRNVLHNVMRYTRALNIEQADRLSLLQSCGFSGTVSSMFGALLNGATSCPMDMRAETPARVAQWLDEILGDDLSLGPVTLSKRGVGRAGVPPRARGPARRGLGHSSRSPNCSAGTSRRRASSPSDLGRLRRVWCVRNSLTTAARCLKALYRLVTR